MGLTERFAGRISEKSKEKLEEIKKETNNEINERYIIECFLKEYCSTNPKGLKIKIKELEEKKKEKQAQVNNLHEDITKLEIKLKTYKDQLNKTLDGYIDEDLIKAVNSVIETSKQKNIELFEDIPELTFISIAKYNQIDLKTLKDEVKKAF